jgi:hypothetical protein
MASYAWAFNFKQFAEEDFTLEQRFIATFVVI